MAYTIRPWEPKDSTQLIKLIGSCLRETAAAGADWAPSERNVHGLFQLGLAWAAAGDPALVLVDSTEQVVGYTLWGRLDTMAEGTCAGLGTYIEPELRGSGLVSRLREWAFNIARNRGYSRVLGSCYDDRALKSTLKLGFKPCGVLVEKIL